jgi:predicted nuclease of predicted toxin-antitoxin system
MKVLVDMNLSPRWAERIQAAGIESVHWSSVGARTAPDPEVMDWARRNGYLVLTQDLDLGAILASSRAGGPSVVILRMSALPDDAAVSRTVAVLRGAADDLKKGAVVSVDSARSRVRILPIA